MSNGPTEGPDPHFESYCFNKTNCALDSCAVAFRNFTYMVAIQPILLTFTLYSQMYLLPHEILSLVTVTVITLLRYEKDFNHMHLMLDSHILAVCRHILGFNV